MTQTVAEPPWLAIVGIGEDGVAGLSPAAGKLVAAAEIVFGGERHLALAASLIGGTATPWPSPFDRSAEAVLACRGRRVCVLASGDPFHYGIGPLLAARIPPAEMVVVPAASSFSLAAARLGWALPEATLLSLHGRSLDLVRPHLHPGARILALTSDGDGPRAVANLLDQSGFGGSLITVLEALGGPREQIRATVASDFDLKGVNPLNLVAIEVKATGAARIIARAPGLADDLFDHDGQITKREVRALTLSSLAPLRGELLFDIGAGVRLGGDRMDAGGPVAEGDSDRGSSRARGADQAECRGVRRAGARSRRRRRAPGSRRPAATGRRLRRRRSERSRCSRASLRGTSAGGRLVVNAVTWRRKPFCLRGTPLSVASSPGLWSSGRARSAG